MYEQTLVPFFVAFWTHNLVHNCCREPMFLLWHMAPGMQPIDYLVTIHKQS
jgi:hypothetical protein